MRQWRSLCFCRQRCLIFLMQAAEMACLPSCIGDWIIAWRRVVRRKAGMEVGVNSSFVALSTWEAS